MATIRDFYQDRNVFLTGASGFLGKQILEKLLRSCNVQRVYVLVRPKRGKTSQERKEILLKSEIFTRLKMTDQNFVSRVVLVPGDMTSPGMGLSEDDIEILRKEVSVVLHAAASVNFTEKIRDAVTINVLALKEMIKFVKSLPQLQAFVHISTAYVHCYEEYTPECIVRPKQDPQTIMDLIEKETDQHLDELTPKLIHPWPNTYTFTKCLAEWMLHEEADNLPCCIFRPSIIGASAEQPIRGWVDNFNAATGILAGVGIGLCNPIYGKPENVADVVPVDLCANAVIALGWSTAVAKPSRIPVFNFTSGQLNPVTWGDFAYWVQVYYNRCPLKTNTGIPTVVVTKNRLLQYFLDCEGRVKFIFLDLLLHLTGKKPKLVTLHKKAMKGSEVLAYFTSNQWNFASENITNLLKTLCSEDRINFNFDIKSVLWGEYLVHYCQGIKQYALKEDFGKQKEARKSQQRLELLRVGPRLALFLFLLGLLWKTIKRQQLAALSAYLIANIRKLTSVLPIKVV